MERIEEIKELLKSKPANPALNAELAKIFEDCGKFDEAAYYYRNSLKYRRDDHRVQYALGTVLFNMEKYGEALDCFKAAVDSVPDFVSALIFAGRCHEKLGQAGKAVRFYGQAIKVKPQDSDLYYTLGNIHLDNGDLKGAVKNYSYAIELGPPKPEYYMALAAANEKKGDDDEALNNYKFALSLDPDHCQAYKKIADYYEKRNFTDEALEFYKKAFELDPGDHMLANLIGELYCALKKPEEAVVFFKESSRKDPSFQKARDNLEQTYERIIIHGEIDTSGTFNETISRDFYSSAVIRLERAEIIEAAIDLVKSLKFNHNNSHSRSLLGMLKAGMGFIQEALNELSAAISLSAENDEFYFRRGLIKQVTGDMDGAFQDYSAAASLKPLEHYYYCRAVVLMAKNDKYSAFSSFSLAGLQPSVSIFYVKTLASLFQGIYPLSVKNLKKEYYESGALMSASFYNGYRKEGFSKFFYETGTLSEVVYYRDGVAEGVSLTFEGSGRLVCETYFHNGMEHGVRRRYSPEGTLLREAIYYFDHSVYERFYDEFGVPLNGVMKSFEKEGLYGDEIYENGELKGECRYYNLGKKLIAVKNYLNGSPEGKFEFFYENGNIQRREYYENGKLEKISRSYFPDGVTCEVEKSYKGGLLNGTARYFDRSGTLLREENYKNDKKDGPAKYYAVEKSLHYLKYEINYSEGRETGTAKKLDPSGSVLKQIFSGSAGHFDHAEWDEFFKDL